MNDQPVPTPSYTDEEKSFAKAIYDSFDRSDPGSYMSALGDIYTSWEDGNPRQIVKTTTIDGHFDLFAIARELLKWKEQS